MSDPATAPVESDKCRTRRKSASNWEFLLAAECGDEDKVDDLLASGAHVNFQDADGNTCLHLAAGDILPHLLAKDKLKKIVENRNNETALDVFWNTRKDETVYETVEILGQVVEKEARHIVSEHKLCQQSENTKVEEKKSFVDATVLGDYKYQYTRQDVCSLLTVFCPPLPVDEVNEVIEDALISFKFILGHLSPQKSVNLIQKAESTYYHLSWNSQELNVKGQVMVTSNNDPDEDMTIPLLKVKTACDCLLETKSGGLKNKGQSLKAKILKEFKNLPTVQDGRKLFANILNEIERTDEKMSACRTFINKLLQEKDKVQQCDYETSNILIHFVETFALQDTHFRIPMTKQEEKQWAAKKKKFYLRFYPPAFEEGHKKNVFLEAMQSLRQKLAHNDTTYDITPEDIRTFITHVVGVDVADFFRHLQTFAEYVFKRRNGPSSDQAPKEKERISVFFQKLLRSSEQFSKLENSELKRDTNCLNRFCENIKEIEENPAVVQKLWFDLVVNVCPKLDMSISDTKPNLQHVRNKAVHEFHNESKRKLYQKLPSAVQDWYRLRLSSDVHQVLFNSNKDSMSSILDELKGVLTKVNKTFSNLLVVYDVTDNATTQPFNDWKLESFQRPQENKDISDIYVSYLATVFDRVDESDDGDMISTPLLNSIQKREILEKVYSLNKMRVRGEASKEEFTEAHEEFKMTLKEKYHFEQKDANTVSESVRIGVSESELKQEIEEYLNRICSLLYDLKRSTLSRHDLVLYYDIFFHSSSEDFLADSNLNQEEKDVIRKRFQSLPSKSETREMKYGEERVLVGVCSIILNLLRIETEVERVKQLKFDTIESAFNDDNFLSYASRVTVKNSDPSRAYSVVASIHDIPCIAPYISKLLVSIKDGGNFFRRVYESGHLEKILRHLLACKETKHFERVVSLKSKQVVETIFKILVAETFSQHKIKKIYEALHQSGVVHLCENAIVQSLKTILKSKEQKERLYAFTQAGHWIILESIKTYKPYHAQREIRVLKTILDRMCEMSPEIQIDIQYNVLKAEQLLLEAKILNTDNLFEDSCAVLESLTKEFREKVTDEIRPYYFLGLSRLAYTQYKLGRANISCQTQKQLWEELCKYIAPHETPARNIELFHCRAKSSSKYTSMLEKNVEFYKYLNVCKAYKNLVWHECCEAWLKKDSEVLERSLRQWDALYDIYKGDTDHRLRDHSMMIILKEKARVHENLYQINPVQYHKFKALELCLLQHAKATEIFGMHSSRVAQCIGTIERLLSNIKGIKRQAQRDDRPSKQPRLRQPLQREDQQQRDGPHPPTEEHIGDAGHSRTRHHGAQHRGTRHRGAQHHGALRRGAQHRGAQHRRAQHHRPRFRGARHPGARHPGARHPGARHRGAQHRVRWLPGTERHGVQGRRGADRRGSTGRRRGMPQ